MPEILTREIMKKKDNGGTFCLTITQKKTKKLESVDERMQNRSQMIYFCHSAKVKMTLSHVCDVVQ